MKFKESAMAHQFLDGLTGIEIGGSAHNQFGLKTLNVDYCNRMDTPFKLLEIQTCGEALPVHIVANGNNLPLPDNSTDFVISSHVLEHFFDPIKTLKEWYRVTRPQGYIYVIVPREDFNLTPIQELLDRHEGNIQEPIFEIHESENHWARWNVHTFVQMCNTVGFRVVAHQEIDDKVGNGFTVVIQK